MAPNPDVLRFPEVFFRPVRSVEGENRAGFWCFLRLPEVFSSHARSRRARKPPGMRGLGGGPEVLRFLRSWPLCAERTLVGGVGLFTAIAGGNL